MKKLSEPIARVIDRVEARISEKKKPGTFYNEIVVLEITDVERLIHAAVWGDD